MAVRNKQIKLLKNQKGQALIEFILFFPFLIMMYSVTLSIANSINASINQQKQARAYFYYRLQNNSMAPFTQRGKPESYTRFGAIVNLWGVKLLGENPVAACFKLNIPLGRSEGDECEEAYSDKSTQYIRVGTAYGVCGATYDKSTGQIIRLPNYSPRAAPNEVVADSACLYR